MFNIELCRAQILTEWDFTMSPSTKKERKKERKKKDNIYEKVFFKMFKRVFLN